MNKLKNIFGKFKEFDKKTKIYVYVGLAMILLIIIMALASCGSDGGGSSYESLENKMEKETINYLEDNPEKAPKEGEEVVILTETLVQGEYLKPLEELLDDGASCSGKTYVTNVDGEYYYTPILDCGTNYSHYSLKNMILKNEELQTNKEGLYQNGEEYLFKGTDVQNYVSLDEKLWRVLKIDSNSVAHLILDEIDNDMFDYWDQSYTAEEGRNRGLNNYELSNIKKVLEKYYENEEFISNETKAKLTTNDVCIGKRGKTQSFAEGEVECSTTINTEIALINVYDYARASLDATCLDPSNLQCQNYNYLGAQFNWWTLTGNTDNSYEVYMINSDKKISATQANNRGGIRPVIYLRSNVFVESGTGTVEDPYILK